MKLAFHHFVVNEVYLTEEDKEDAYLNARFGAVSYIPPLSLAMLLSRRKESRFVNFHAKQAFVIMLVMLLGFVFSGWLRWGIEAVTWIFALIGFFYAATGKYFAIPGIIHLLSFQIIHDSPVVKKVRSARAAEVSNGRTKSTRKQ